MGLCITSELQHFPNFSAFLHFGGWQHSAWTGVNCRYLRAECNTASVLSCQSTTTSTELVAGVGLINYAWSGHNEIIPHTCVFELQEKRHLYKVFSEVCTLTSEQPSLKTTIGLYTLGQQETSQTCRSTLNQPNWLGVQRVTVCTVCVQTYDTG